VFEKPNRSSFTFVLRWPYTCGRWYDEKWHEYGKDLQTPARLRPLPLETRSLWSPKSNAPQVGCGHQSINRGTHSRCTPSFVM
jgi:hypothetical protein